MDNGLTEESLIMEPLAPAGTPYLMQCQEKAFAGDVHLAEEILRLKEKHGLSHAVETGTYIGTTTLWLAKYFKEVTTAEIDEKLFLVACERFDKAPYEDIYPYNLPGADILDEIKGDYLFFADAHPIDGSGKGYDVIIGELEAIAAGGFKPSVMVLHDFQVPGRPEMQFDKFDRKPFTYEWVKPSLDKIYGVDGYTYHYNSHATGAKVGVLFIEKKREITEPIENPVQ